MNPNETIATDGLTIDREGNVQTTKLLYNKKDTSRLYGYGIRVSGKMARKLIKNYWDDNPVSENTPCAFTFGKESLLSILTQTDCEGIRFYLAKKKFNSESTPDGTTLVAIGVKPEVGQDGVEGNDPEIGAEDAYIIEKLDAYSDENDNMKIEQNGIIIETIPPLSLHDANAGICSPNVMGKIMNIYIDYSQK